MTTETWTLHPDLVLLLGQVDRRWPRRSTKSDGDIGDARHAAQKSDHNPNERGVVCAIDVTHDPLQGCDGYTFAEALRRSRDRRISYVIWNRQMFSSYTAKDGTAPWTWRPYTGSNPHDKHVHVSVNDVTPWTIEPKE